MRSLPALLLLAACNSAGPFERDRFEAIVSAARPLAREPHRLYRFRLDADLDARTLAPLGSDLVGRGDGRGLVRAVVDASHHLAVSIETVDNGHAGESGFMYVDPGFDHADLEDVQRDSQHETRVDDRWVRWSYDLD